MALATETSSYEELRKRLLGATQPTGTTEDPQYPAPETVTAAAQAPTGTLPLIEPPGEPPVEPEQPPSGQFGDITTGPIIPTEPEYQDPGTDIETPPVTEPGIEMPGGGIDADTFSQLFGQALDPIQQQIDSLTQQFQGFQPTSPDELIQALLSSGGLGDLTGLLQQIQSGAGPMGPEQMEALTQNITEALSNQIGGTQSAGSEQFQGLQEQLDQLTQMFSASQPQAPAGDAAAAGAAPPAYELTPEQIEAIFAGTGDATQMPGFLFGPDYFRSLADQQYQIASQNPAAELQGIMGDVIGAGPASMGDLGQVLAGRLTSPSVFEGDLGSEMLGAVRGLTNVDTGPAAQQYQNALDRLGMDRDQALRQQSEELNRLGLFADGQASGAVLPSRLNLQDTFGRLQNELTTNYAAQQAQREDALRQSQLGAYGGLLGGTQGARQASSEGLAGLLGLQQAGQGQTMAGLSDLARQITGAQQNQLGALSGLSGQTFGQNVGDIQLQNLFSQQETQQKNQLLNELLGLTSPVQTGAGVSGFAGGGGGGSSMLGDIGQIAALAAMFL